MEAKTRNTLNMGRVMEEGHIHSLPSNVASRLRKVYKEDDHALLSLPTLKQHAP